VLDAEFADRAVYLPAAAALVLADLHVGRGDASAVEFPLGEGRDLTDRLAALVSRFHPEEVVFAGDIVHEFGRVTGRTRETLDALTAACRERGARPVFVTGNHDAVLSTTWDGPVHDAYRPAADVLVCHGHEEPDGHAGLYVLGHDHPAISIEGRKRPCFLYGPGCYRGGDVLMLPAFSRLAAGAAVNRMWTDDFQSPLVTDADALRPVVFDPDRGATLSFPPLGQFRRML
jgi:hypothetical protein